MIREMDEARHCQERGAILCVLKQEYGAEMVALRTTLNSEGCNATMTTNTTTMTARAMRIFMSIVYLLLLQAAPKRLRGEARFLVIVSVKRDREIFARTNTSHEHEFKRGD